MSDKETSVRRAYLRGDKSDPFRFWARPARLTYVAQTVFGAGVRKWET